VAIVNFVLQNLMDINFVFFYKLKHTFGQRFFFFFFLAFVKNNF
jgi:hypothetical protein